MIVSGVRHPRSSRVPRVITVAAALVLAANAIVLLAAAASPDDARHDTADARAVARAVLALASAPAPGPDPLAGITVVEAPVVESSDAAPLPVPEPPPANAYAPTPEIRHGTLEIPSIGLRQPFFEGVTLTAINRGPSHWPGTAMPGEVGNVVVAGHRTTYTRPFWDLQAVEPGDELVFTMNDGTRHVYELDRIEIVSPTDVHIVEQTPDRTATLFGCHPRGSARQRIVGHFRLKAPTRTLQLADTHLIRAPTAA